MGAGLASDASCSVVVVLLVVLEGIVGVGADRDDLLGPRGLIDEADLGDRWVAFLDTLEFEDLRRREPSTFDVDEDGFHVLR